MVQPTNAKHTKKQKEIKKIVHYKNVQQTFCSTTKSTQLDPCGTIVNIQSDIVSPGVSVCVVVVQPQRTTSSNAVGCLEVHGAVSQVVLAANVGHLFGLHGLQLGTVRDTMAETAAERTAPLACAHTQKNSMNKTSGKQKFPSSLQERAKNESIESHKLESDGT